MPVILSKPLVSALFLFSIFATTTVLADTVMDNKTLQKIITAQAQDHEKSENIVKFAYNGVAMIAITDERYDRMRIIAPILPYEQVTPAQVDTMMYANFHSALDARYAVSDGVLYSTFIHPLASLSQDAIISALNQVASLALSFGGEYSSKGISFGGEQEEEKPTEETKKPS